MRADTPLVQAILRALTLQYHIVCCVLSRELALILLYLDILFA